MDSNTFNPSWQELEDWFSAVHVDYYDTALLEKIADMQEELRNFFYEETGIVDPPSDCTHPEVTLNAEEYVEMRTAIGETNEQNLLSAELKQLEKSFGEHNPSRAELHQWLEAACAAGDSDRALRVTNKGIDMRDLFIEETGDSGALPPLDYRHPDISISADDYQEMLEAINPPEPKKQMELD